MTDEVVAGAAAHASNLRGQGASRQQAELAEHQKSHARDREVVKSRLKGADFTPTPMSVASGVAPPVPQRVSSQLYLDGKTAEEVGAKLSNVLLAGLLESNGWPCERWAVGTAKAQQPKETGEVMKKRLIEMNGSPYIEMKCDEEGNQKAAPWRGHGMVTPASALASGSASASSAASAPVVALAMEVEVAPEVAEAAPEAEAAPVVDAHHPVVVQVTPVAVEGTGRYPGRDRRASRPADADLDDGEPAKRAKSRRG